MSGPGLDWREFSALRPGLAGKQLLYQFGLGLAFLGTVRSDGGPRLHPFPADENEDAFMLAGTARLTEEGAVRDRLEARYRHERSQPASTAMQDQDLFEFLIERCQLTRTTGHGDPSPRHVVWTAP